MPITAIGAHFSLFGTIHKNDDGIFIASCPPLEVMTQGRTEEEARANLVETCELYIETCLEEGTLDKAIRELGWAAPGQNRELKVPSDAFLFDLAGPEAGNVARNY